MMKRWISVFLPLLAALALVVTACASGEAPEVAEEAAPAATEAAPAATEAPEPAEPAPSEPIKIGQLSDLTSTFTPWGVQVRDGMALAAKEINEAGGVNGRMIEIIIQDSENDGDIGVDRLERLVEDGVVAVGGILSSGVGAPVGAVAEQLQMPLFLVKSGTEAALTADSRYTFRTCLPAAPMDAGPVLQYAREQGFTKVGGIIADYPWGQAFKSAMENAFEGSGVEFTIEVAPVPPSTDFTPFVRAMSDFDAEMIVATGHPPGNASIVTLSADLHDVPVTGAWTPPNLVVGGLQDLAIGRYTDFSCADYFSDSYADLARRYLAFSDNQFMSDDAVAGYGIVTMVAEAVGEVGDDPVAIAEYLHANSFELPGYAHTMSWTEWGELAESRPIFTIISAGPAPEGLNEAGDWWFELLTHADPLEPYVPGGTTGPAEPTSSEPIKIGQLSDLTSTFTPWSVNVRDGMALAAQEINEAGGVNGRMIEIIVQDSENDGDIGVDRFERLVEEGVVAVGGPISSGVGAPVAATAEQLQVPLLLVKSGTEVALTADSRYTFRTCLPAAPMVAGPVLQYAQEQGFTKVGTIVADYPWGKAVKSAIENTFEGSGVEFTIEVAPVPPSTDFTPFVRAMSDFDAEMIVATGHPPGNAAITALSADLHDVPVTGAWTPPNLVVGGLQDLAIGRYTDFSCADYFSDSYADLARRYLAFSDNEFMSDDAVAGYGIVTMVAEAVGEVGDDPVAIAEYLHANSFELPGYAHTMSWTEWGELAESRPIFTIISAGPAPEGLNEAGDWWFELLTHADPLEPYVPGQ
jgi:branched-chain amino acid transport system substrate-binding protein